MLKEDWERGEGGVCRGGGEREREIERTEKVDIRKTQTAREAAQR